MFTVILLSETAKAIFEPVRAYFDPFIEAGDIALCEWDQSARARQLSDAVPGLPELIQGKSAWRAVVVDHPRGADDPGLRAERDAENPFDFTENTSANLALTDSPHAVIRIAHMLLGYPHLSAKHFEPYLQYEDRDTGELISGDPRALLERFEREAGRSITAPGGVGHGRRGENSATGAAGESARADLATRAADAPSAETPRSDDDWFSLAAMTIGERHNHVRRLFREVPYSAEEQAVHAELVQRYSMKEVRPSEVVFVATRAPVEEDEKAELQRAWRSDTEHQPSRFIERNDYPPMSRFAVYDLLEPENSGYDQDQLRFWLSVLTTATNLLPPGGFQADRVYQLGVDFAADGLGSMLNDHLSKLVHARDRVDRIIHTAPREPEQAVQDLLRPVETPVVFDDLGGEELRARSTGYGLASDHPRDEHGRWVGEVGTVASAAALFMRKPRRAVVRAVAEARRTAQATPAPEEPLTALGREELQDSLAQRLESLVVPTTAKILDQRSMNDAIRSGDRSVRSEISQRMRRSTIVLACAVTLGVWLAALAPYALQAARRGAEPLAHSLGVIVLVLALLGAATLLTLWALKLRLRGRIHGFNERIRTEVLAVKAGADRFAQFLSEFVTYRLGAERLRSSTRTSAAQATRMRDMRVLRDRIAQKIQEEKEIVRGIGVPLEMHGLADSLYTFDPLTDDPDKALFGFPPGESQIPFNHSGEVIDAPYDFVTRLTLTRLSLHDAADPLEQGASA